MADDKTKTAEDRLQINVNERYEASNWAKKFGVTEEELRRAVAKVGTSAKAVEAHLGRAS